jgi:formylmethanofuran dehydrogenase subunit E-like metal-binding protein
MSFDLAFWYADGPVNAVQALATYEAILREEPDCVAANSAVARFNADVVSVFPDLTAENMNDSPWSSPLYSSDAFAVASINWSRQAVMLQALIALAKKHGLICYDPQSGTVFQ